MGLMEINWCPDNRQLRRFGWISLIGFSALGLLWAWRMNALAGAGRWTVPVALWAVGLGLGVLGWASPKAIRPAYVLLVTLSLPIGWAMMHVVLALLYFAVLTPIGLVFRLRGRDPLARRFDPKAPSYWVERPGAPAPARYFRQF